MTEEELKAAQDRLEADRNAFEAEKAKHEANKATKALVTKYNKQIEEANKRIADLEDTIELITNGQKPPEQNKGTKGEKVDVRPEYKKYFRI